MFHISQIKFMTVYILFINYYCLRKTINLHNLYGPLY